MTFLAQIMPVNTFKCYVEMCVNVEFRENRLKEAKLAYTENKYIFRMKKNEFIFRPKVKAEC